MTRLAGPPTDQFDNPDTLDGYLDIGRGLFEQIDGEAPGLAVYVRGA